MGVLNPTSPPAALVREWYRTGLYADETIGQAILGSTDQGRITFSSDEGEQVVQRADLAAAACASAAGLRALGVGPGDVVAVQQPAGADSWALVGGAWILGAVVCPIVDIYGPNELGFILDQTGARILATTTEWRGRSGLETARAAGFEGTVVALGPETSQGAVPLAAIRDQGAVSGAIAVGADEVALLVYTSGTTAAPKGVQHTHNTLLSSMRGLPSSDGGPATLATFPAGHIAGTIAALRALVRGGDVVVMDRWSATRAAALIERHGVGFAAGTPFYLRGLLDAAERDDRDISSLATFLTGAAPVPPSLLERAEAAGILGWRTYGSTEHPAISSGSPLDDIATRHGTDGRVSPMVEIRLVNEDLSDVPPGAEGEIVVRGPKQFVGYRDPAMDVEAFLPEGWFRTGDVGRLDDDRRLTITDRRKDIIIRGGENISSKEVEDVLATLDGVLECAVCAQPDDALGEVVAAFVLTDPRAAPDLDTVRAHFAAAGVPPQKAPEVLHVVDDFPRTAAGKIVKAALRDSLR